MDKLDKAYHNKGFGPAFLWVIFLFLVVPTIIMFSIDDGWAKFVQMRGINGDCWENAQHEVVCKGEVECKFWRNFCTPTDGGNG